MATQRHGRVQETIRREISIIVQNEIKDPRIGFLTVTSVEVTRDLRYAKIYFSVLGEEKAGLLALKGLKSARGFVRTLLGERIKLRILPEIEFKIDKSWERAKNIDDVLNKIKKERDDAEGHRGA